MNPLENMNQAMAYLEENLLEEIDFTHMAKLAGCSEYHFRRVFSYLAGMSLSEYLRCRKLVLAGDLLKQGAKVIDTATLLGYDSSDAWHFSLTSKTAGCYSKSISTNDFPADNQRR